MSAGDTRARNRKDTMFRDGLYHVQVWLPFLVTRIAMMLTPSRHAADRAYEKNIRIPKYVDPQAQVIEVERSAGKVTKILYRQHYDAKNDLCMAVLTKNGVIKTVWLNRKDDKHRTLDVRKYVQKP